MLLPSPQGLEPGAWQYFGIFLAVIVALVLEPIPPAASGLIGITLAAALLLVPAQPPDSARPTRAQAVQMEQTQTAVPGAQSDPRTPVVKPDGGLKPAAFAQKPGPKPSDEIKWLLSGFSDSTVWLIFVAFMFALGYEKTGLGRRISLLLIKKLGKRTLGLGYAVALADLALAPFMPSITARSGGTIFPILKNIPPLYGSTPEQGQRKIGSYLMWTSLAATCVTSSMFLTALAPNLLAVSLIQKTANINISWMEWFTAFLPVGLVLFLAVPYLAYLIYTPTLKSSEDAPRWAGDELAKMGKITSREISMACLALISLILWIFAGELLNATTVALLSLCAMVVLGVISWDDVLGYKQAWNVLLWFATLVTMADGLNRVGFLPWFAGITAGNLHGVSPVTGVVLLGAIFFLLHYMFASITAHVTALLPVFLSAVLLIHGMPVRLISLVFSMSLGLMGVLTPYATGPSPIYYGSGYISSRDFWRLGFVFGIIYLAVYLGIGVPYMLMLGIQ